MTNAIDRLLRYRGNPNSLADFTWGALRLDNSTLARHVYTAATAGIPFPTARILHTTADDRTGALCHLSVPMARTNVNRLCVVNRFAYRMANRSIASLLNGFAHRIANRLCLGFPDRLAHRIANRLCLGFPDRLAHRVANRLCLGFPDRLAHRVVARTIARLVHRFAHRILAIAIARLTYITNAIDFLFFTNRLVNGLVASHFLLFVHHLTAGTHYRMAILRTTGIAAHFIAVCALPARRSVTQGGIDGHHAPDYRQYRKTKRSHFPFSSFGNSTCGPGTANISPLRYHTEIR